MADRARLTVEVASGVSGLDPAAWDRLAADAPPFVEHAFLAALEASGCVGAAAGWYPQILVARRAGGELVGAAPAYLKTHSMGEFVYDWAWADAAQRMGLPYYPKVVVAAPFSPVAGPRLLVDPGLAPGEARAVRRGLLAAAVDLARQTRCAGVHVLFCTEEERDLAVGLGFAARTGLQFHWRNEGYATFDDFLERFRSRRRKSIRRERRALREAGVEVRSFAGDEVLDEHLPLAFRWYAATVDGHVWGRRYLNERFFELLWERMRPRLQVLVAERGGVPLGGSLSLEKGGRRYGRYWGCDEEVPFLHFEVCYYAAAEDCIARGIEVFEAGAGGGSHKYGRGFLPALTWSAHRLFDARFHAAVADFCAREDEAVRAEAAELDETLFAR